MMKMELEPTPLEAYEQSPEDLTEYYEGDIQTLENLEEIRKRREAGEFDDYDA